MIPEKTIKDLLKKHTSLEKDLSTGNIDKKNFAEKSKEYAELNEIIKIAKLYISFEKNKKEIQKILEIFSEIIQDLKNYELEQRILDLESKFTQDLSEDTFNELKELKKLQKIN